MSTLHPNRFHPKRRSACDRCHGQKMRCTRPAGQHDCTRCLRLRKSCHYSPATGTAPKRDARPARLEAARADVSSTTGDCRLPGDDPRGSRPPGEAPDLSLADLVQKNGYDLFFPPELWSFPGPQEDSALGVSETVPASNQMNGVGPAPSESLWSSEDSNHQIDSLSMAWNSTKSVEQEDTLPAASPTILQFLTELTGYFNMIPFECSTSSIQTCPTHGGPLTPPQAPTAASNKSPVPACLDCAAEAFRVENTFKLAEELIGLQPKFLSELYQVPYPSHHGNQQPSPPHEDLLRPTSRRTLDLGAAFLLISCHHRMISIWELIAGRLCSVLRKQATGEILPSSNKSCAFLTVGAFKPSPKALESLYRSFLREIAERLQACAKELVEYLSKSGAENCGDSVQHGAVITAAEAVRQRGAIYLAVMDQDAS